MWVAPTNEQQTEALTYMSGHVIQKMDEDHLSKKPQVNNKFIWRFAAMATVYWTTYTSYAGSLLFNNQRRKFFSSWGKSARQPRPNSAYSHSYLTFEVHDILVDLTYIQVTNEHLAPFFIFNGQPRVQRPNWEVWMMSQQASWLHEICVRRDLSKH